MGRGLYPQLRELLLAHGCEFKRQGKGSHEIWFSPVNERSFPVAVTIGSRVTANAILKQAAIRRKL